MCQTLSSAGHIYLTHSSQQPSKVGAVSPWKTYHGTQGLSDVPMATEHEREFLQFMCHFFSCLIRNKLILHVGEKRGKELVAHLLGIRQFLCIISGSVMLQVQEAHAAALILQSRKLRLRIVE